jgi:hypothetical protein
MQAWWEDAEGNRTRITPEEYDAWGRGELVIPGAVHGALARRFNTPSGYIEDDVVVEVAGITYACLRAQRHMGEEDDIVFVPANWRTTVHEIRPGVRVENGDIVHDDERPKPPMPRGR